MDWRLKKMENAVGTVPFGVYVDEYASKIKKTWKDSKFWRAIRRFGAVFITGGIATVATYLVNITGEQRTEAVIIATSLVLMAEKYIRDYTKEWINKG